MHLQSDELFADLRDLQPGVALVKYPDEGHVPLGWSNANQIDFCQHVIAWFDDHLRKEDDKPQAATQKPN